MEKTACPLCGGTKTTATTIEEKIYYFCSQCDLAFLAAPFHPSPEREKERYLLHNNSLEDKGYVGMFEAFLEQAVVPFVGKNVEALDFGCGPAPVLQVLLERKGIRTDVYDPYFAPELPPPGKQYDLITCTEVLEHVRRPREVWQFFSRRLRPGGILAAMTAFRPPREEFARWWYRQDFTHVCFYSRETFFWLARHYPLRLVFLDRKNTAVMKRA
ncbi:MAG TPA: class I SAM-dependent methyltransferase [Firmicutes bacterium]|nr:class I SAM-dependent methyltransferase [Bacillota bacterium]